MAGLWIKSSRLLDRQTTAHIAVFSEGKLLSEEQSSLAAARSLQVTMLTILLRQCS